jgi:hypothetical protein
MYNNASFNVMPSIMDVDKLEGSDCNDTSQSSAVDWRSLRFRRLPTESLTPAAPAAQKPPRMSAIHNTASVSMYLTNIQSQGTFGCFDITMGISGF